MYEPDINERDRRYDDGDGCIAAAHPSHHTDNYVTPVPLRHQCSPVCRHSPLRDHQYELRDTLEEQIAMHRERRLQKSYVSPKIGARMVSPSVSTRVQHEIPVLKLKPELANHRFHFVDADTRRERILRARALGEALQAQIEEAERRRRPPPPTPLTSMPYHPAPKHVPELRDSESEKYAAAETPMDSHLGGAQQQDSSRYYSSQHQQHPPPMQKSVSPDRHRHELPRRAHTSLEMSAPVLQVYSGNFTTHSVGKRGKPTAAGTTPAPNVFQSLPDLRAEYPLLGGKPLFDLDAREMLEQQRLKEAALRTEQLKADLKREIEERERRRKAAEAREKALELELEDKARNAAAQFADEERRRQDEATKAAAETNEANKQLAEIAAQQPPPGRIRGGRRSVPPLDMATPTINQPTGSFLPQDATQRTAAESTQRDPSNNRPAVGTDDIVVALREIKEELLVQRRKLDELPPVRPHHPAMFVAPPSQRGFPLKGATEEQPGPLPFTTERFLLRDTAKDILDRNQTRLSALRGARDSNEILQAFLLQDANAALRSLSGTRLPPSQIPISDDPSLSIRP